MAINTVVSTDTITVLGPPSNIQLQVDIGPAGKRGSLIFSGAGDPNVLVFTEPIQLGDLFIRTDRFGGNYGTIYKYNSVPSGNVWQETLAFQPISYNQIFDVEFTDGVGQFNIPVSTFYVNAPANLTAEQISVQVTPEYTSPIAISVLSKGLTTGLNRNLVVELRAATFSGGNWIEMFENVNILVTLSVL
jgi:hypothetical protein